MVDLNIIINIVYFVIKRSFDFDEYSKSIITLMTVNS